VALDETVVHASLTSYKALDVVGFAQFKQKYEQWMEEPTRSNPGRITKEEFLIEIEKPYIEGLSPENIMKAFKVTGTWPVDRSKVSTSGDPKKNRPISGV